VRKLFGWMAGLAGIAALARLLSARKARVERPAPAPADPADALRDKLAETRAEPAPTRDEELGESLDERRARIHAKAQETIDSMLEPPS
jgi:hypothetical protein